MDTLFYKDRSTMKSIFFDWIEKIFPDEDTWLWFRYAMFRRGFSLLVDLPVFYLGWHKIGGIATIILLASFCLLRRYIGGFHAGSPILCVFLSVLQTVICVYLLFPLMYRFSVVWDVFWACLSTVIFYMFAPLLPQKLNVASGMIPVYRKKTMQTACAEISIIFLFACIGWRSLSLCGSLGMMCAAASLLIEKILRKQKEG